MTALQRPESAARALTKLPADRRARVPVTTRHRDDGSAGQGGTPSAARWVTADGVPAK
jgi:hypothetical protein